MADTKKLLEHRTRTKKNKPAFVSKDAQVTVRVKSRWRKPRGTHSPVRQKHKGRVRMATPGYGSPKAVKHLHHSGLQPITIQTQTELIKLNPETHGLVLSGKIGSKKRIELIKLAQEKKFTILNFKEASKHLEKLESQFQARQQSKKKKLTEKEKKDEEKKKQAEEKEKKEQEEKQKEEKPEEAKEKQQEEKKEAEKTIIKKQ